MTMLIQKPVAEQDVVTIRLVSGEEIVGRLTTETDTQITLSKPISIGIQMVAQNQAQLAFSPFMASVDDGGSLTFNKASLVTLPAKTREDVKTSYIRATSSLEVPTKPSLIGV